MHFSRGIKELIQSSSWRVGKDETHRVITICCRRCRRQLPILCCSYRRRSSSNSRRGFIFCNWGRMTSGVFSFFFSLKSSFSSLTENFLRNGVPIFSISSWQPHRIQQLFIQIPIILTRFGAMLFNSIVQFLESVPSPLTLVIRSRLRKCPRNLVRDLIPDMCTFFVVEVGFLFQSYQEQGFLMTPNGTSGSSHTVRHLHLARCR